MKNQNLTIRALTATTVAALVNALGVTDVDAQSLLNNASAICPNGKVPGYVSTGCVNDHQRNKTSQTDAVKNRIKGAPSEPPTKMLGLGVPTVNVSSGKIATSAK
jgi:hypothetical protein